MFPSPAHSHMYSDSRYSGTDTNILTIQLAKKSDEGQYRRTVRNQMEGKESEEAHLALFEESFVFLYLRVHAVSFTLP